MGFESRPNTGALFENKRDNKSVPDGSIEITCARCHETSGWWINAWRKTSKNGLAYISLALKPKWENENTTPTPSNSEDVKS